MGLLGLHWPQANEDELVKLADELKSLVLTIDSTQLAADKAMKKVAEVCHGTAADRMAGVWADISKYSGMIVEACETTSTALHAAAVVIEVCKGETLTQLTTIQAELDAASSSGGWGIPAIIAAGKAIVSRILDEAVNKLAAALTKPLADLADAAVRTVTGGAPAQSNGQGFGVDLAQITSCALELRRHADDVDSKGSSFRRIVESLDLGQPGDMFGKLAVAAGEQIAKIVGMQVLNRVLGSFRGTADRMDLMVKNLTDNEDSNTREMNGGFAWQTPGGPSLLQLSSLTGGSGAGATGGGIRDAGLSAFDGLRPHLGGGVGGAGAGGFLGGFETSLNSLGFGLSGRGRQPGAPTNLAGGQSDELTGQSRTEQSRLETGTGRTGTSLGPQLGLPVGLGRVLSSRSSEQQSSSRNGGANGVSNMTATQDGGTGTHPGIGPTPGMMTTPVAMGHGGGGSTLRGQGVSEQIRMTSMAQQRNQSRRRDENRRGAAEGVVDGTEEEREQADSYEESGGAWRE
ncbi:hypothetical protein [Kitasatospora sp. MAP5-34]|uniref:WXG100-like domain-containing protein n=1 Tax=Kitasatospora sp. MAP5-34 TaxID=3035102 RepID=UPI0024762F36|nr:hypothetical protein [Kitasatospora sp. MAP5-34]MDH6578228.1 hypothetical protein [Kitasatospora sp. MAP5-34]